VKCHGGCGWDSDVAEFDELVHTTYNSPNVNASYSTNKQRMPLAFREEDMKTLVEEGEAGDA